MLNLTANKMILRVIFGLGTCLLAVSWAGTPGSSPTALPRPLSLFKKERPLGLERPVDVPFHSELSLVPTTLQNDPVEQREFIQEACGKKRPSKSTTEDGLLGTLGAVASYTCAGIAAVQWLDKQAGPKGKKGQGKDAPTKTP